LFFDKFCVEEIQYKTRGGIEGGIEGAIEGGTEGEISSLSFR
jgi:hypothetical protein